MATGFVVWALSLSLLMARWMAPHVLPLRAESNVADASTWTATHLLRVDCDCSAEVYRHLAARGVQPGWRERVHLNRPRAAWADTLQKSGFEVTITPVRSGPRLALIDPAGRTWQGGYAEHRPQPGVAFEDLSTMHTFRAGGGPGRVPAYGCASNNL